MKQRERCEFDQRKEGRAQEGMGGEAGHPLPVRHIISVLHPEHDGDILKFPGGGENAL